MIDTIASMELYSIPVPPIEIPRVSAVEQLSIFETSVCLNCPDVDLQNANIWIGYVAKFIEIFGILTILIGGFVATYRFVHSQMNSKESSYENFRTSLGQAILLLKKDVDGELCAKEF